ncbi:APC family permease [Thiohalobacter sp.]|uniref:APC family permease n=1 Tax=Thiohalobacter sp. TaxID=2025948 RepID=UPI002612C540|nr:APC family permease [Thiohalobacter sp.]
MSEPNKTLTLTQAVSLAIGTMIGASIFSIFGLGARLAGPNLPLVFIMSGILALLVAYSYAWLGGRIVSNAGPMEFIIAAFGSNLVTGALSFLYWLTYVISIALFAKGFSGYLMPLFPGPDTPGLASMIEVGIVLLFTVLGATGSSGVGRAEFWIVAMKIGILLLFVILGIWSIRIERITPQFAGPDIGGMLDAMAIFFLSYMGFGLVTNASENLRNPGRNVPRAIYISIALVTLIYVLVSVVAVGNLPLPDLIKAEDFALAEAARPFLGDKGYLLVSWGALFSIASALNATLYGGANVAYALARDGVLPETFDRKVWFGSVEGLYITAGLGIAFALLFDLGGIAAMTSSIFIVIYLFVLAAHWRLSITYGGDRRIIAIGLVTVASVFVLLLQYQWQTSRDAFYGTGALLAASLVVEWLYFRATGRPLKTRASATA